MTPQPGVPRPVRPRDTGRAGVYAGENQVARLLDRSAEFPVVEVAGSRIALPTERHFGDLAGVQRYVDAVLALDWVLRRWPERARAPVTVRERRGASRAHYEPAPPTIAVPVQGQEARWALRELVVLHELAHHLASDAEGRPPRRDGAPTPLLASDPGHGAGFTARMLELVGGVMGVEIAFLLRVAWIDQGVAIG
jgi:putative metallohydrolase (TIGR04338 family)